MNIKTITVALAVSLLASAASAQVNDSTINGGIKDSFNDNRVTNIDNRIIDNSITLDNSVTNNDNRVFDQRDYSQHNTAKGGEGGTGVGVGLGGTATIGNVSTGPATAINNAGDVDVRTNLNNANTQGQGQDQAQLQGQQQKNVMRDSGNSQSISTSGVDNSGNSVVDVALDGNNSQLTNNAGDVSVKVEGDHFINEAPEIPVASAYAAPSVVGGGVCAYTPFSAGVQVLKFGGSAQGAVIDQGCERRANADVLSRLGFTRQATALLMQDQHVAAAFRAVEEADKVKVYSQAPGTAVTVESKVSASTVAVQDQKSGAILAQGFIDPKKGYRIINPNAKPE